VHFARHHCGILRNKAVCDRFAYHDGSAKLTNLAIGIYKHCSTGQPRAEIRITDNSGVLSARIERSLAPDPYKEQTHCGKCTDDRKDQAIIGMEIVRAARHTDDSDWWEGGQILDADNGKTYTLWLRVNDDTLRVRGYIGLFYRTQTWVRAQ
jgi:hypothetical protein